MCCYVNHNGSTCWTTPNDTFGRSTSLHVKPIAETITIEGDSANFDFATVNFSSLEDHRADQETCCMPTSAHVQFCRSFSNSKWKFCVSKGWFAQTIKRALDHCGKIDPIRRVDVTLLRPESYLQNQTNEHVAVSILQKIQSVLCEKIRLWCVGMGW